MDILQNLGLGLDVAFSLNNLLYCLLGALIGTMVGVLPGLGPVTTIAMLLPLTYAMSPIGAIIMLSGIYYGANHAGGTTAIVLNMPGEPSAIVSCFEGYPLAKQGRAGAALAIVAFASFFAGIVGVILIALFAPLLSMVAIRFGAPEYASMILLALLATAILSGGTLLATLPMVCLGMLLGMIGTDLNSGIARFTFDINGLANGLDFVTLAVGLFGIAEMASRLTEPDDAVHGVIKIRNLIPTKQDIRDSWKAVLRGTGLGAVLGVLPGTGPLISSFASYSLEKQIARDPSRFGKGAMEGLAGPEAAANAAAITHFIPMLTLGIPAGASMALILGAMLIHGIAPGPNVMGEHPDLFWGVVVSMLFGNAMLLVLNLPMIGIWLRLLSIPEKFLYPAILVFCCIGLYSIDYGSTGIILAAIFGAFGYLMAHFDCPPAPLVLGFILEPIFEENFRRSLLISDGDYMIFLRQPISCGFLVVALCLLLSTLLPAMRRSKARLRKTVEAADTQSDLAV